MMMRARGRRRLECTVCHDACSLVASAMTRTFVVRAWVFADDRSVTRGSATREELLEPLVAAKEHDDLVKTFSERAVRV
jgi:hypothetical protein